MEILSDGFDTWRKDAVRNMNDWAANVAPGDEGAVTKLDTNAASLDGKLEVVFRGIHGRLIEEIRTAEIVLGCVAWLTDFDILDELAVKQASIIVQKEDFLRPDVGHFSGWSRALRERYARIGCGIDRYDFRPLVSTLSVACDPCMEGVKCVGNHNRDKKPAFPRMHNKFLVFCESEEIEEGRRAVHPVKVWSGSFNFTKNAGMSMENALILTDKNICEAYFREWQNIYSMSEPLDWTDDWCAPDLRVGT